MSEPANKDEKDASLGTHASHSSGSMPAASGVTKTHAPLHFGRYVLHAPIARGGMAQVYTARLVGAEGFNRLVAAKRLHPQFTDDPDFVAMFHDEARIASRIHHPNVVPVLDVVVEGNEVILVQEYVHGVPLDRLFKAALSGAHAGPIPINIVVAVIGGVLAGLHAAHETKDEMDRPLEIVHRDVSPQNVMVSVDGMPRLLDFGIARAQSCVHVTREGVFKGKVAYMAPEQLRAETVVPATDVYAVGVMLWELLAHRRLHGQRSEAQIFGATLGGALPQMSDVDRTRVTIAPERRKKLVEFYPIIMRALNVLPEQRYTTAEEMLSALLAVCPAATPMEIGAWVKNVGAEYLDKRQKVIAASEESWRSQSKISAATPSASMRIAPSAESSRVMLASPSKTGTWEGFIAPPVLSSWPAGASVETVREPEQATKKARLPWMVAAALLLPSFALAGVLGFGGPSQLTVASSGALDAPIEAIVLAAPPVVDTTPPAPIATPTAAATVRAPVFIATTSAPAAHSKTPAPAKTADKHAPPIVRELTLVPPPAQPPPAPAAKPDCDPPFYFEGTKKIYKPGCL